MLELSVQGQTRGRLLGKGKNVSLRAKLLLASFEATVTEIPIASVVQSMLEAAPEVLPPAHSTKIREENGKLICVLQDLRGRPAESFRNSTSALPHRDGSTREEEFFYSAGSIFDLPATLEDPPIEPAESVKIPFRYQLLTKFNRFTDDGHILHDFTPEISANLSSLLPLLSPRSLIKLVPTQLEQVRLGFEGYQRQFFGAMFGLIPKLQNRFYFEISTSQIQLMLEEEGITDGRTLPFEDSGLLDGLERALASLGLFSELKKQLKQQLTSK